MTERICTKCQLSKPLSAFYKHKRGVDGVDSHCKVCKEAAKKLLKEAIKNRAVYDGPILTVWRGGPYANAKT